MIICGVIIWFVHWQGGHIRVTPSLAWFCSSIPCCWHHGWSSCLGWHHHPGCCYFSNSFPCHYWGGGVLFKSAPHGSVCMRSGLPNVGTQVLLCSNSTMGVRMAHQRTSILNALVFMRLHQWTFNFGTVEIEFVSSFENYRILSWLWATCLQSHYVYGVWAMAVGRIFETTMHIMYEKLYVDHANDKTLFRQGKPFNTLPVQFFWKLGFSKGCPGRRHWNLCCQNSGNQGFLLLVSKRSFKK